MSLAFVIVLAVVAAALIGVKIYFQEKAGQEQLAELQLPKVEEKTHTQIVAERLAEIAEFEEKVSVESKEIKVDSAPVKVENKPKAKTHKKKNPNTKKQPKIKAK